MASKNAQRINPQIVIPVVAGRSAVKYERGQPIFRQGDAASAVFYVQSGKVQITVKSEQAIRLQLEAEIADIELQWKRGQELLGQGFPLEAMRQFESCLAKDKFYAPALQGLAEAHARLGHLEESEMCSHRAKYIREKVLQDRIEAEIRSRHPL